MTYDWGSGEWGDGYWGGSPDHSELLFENWPNEVVRPDEDEAVDDVLTAIGRQLNRLYIETKILQRQRFIDSADGEQLRRLAREVGVRREQGEGEGAFRFRARTTKAVGRSDGTLRDLEDALQVMFGEDVSSLSVATPDSSPTVQIFVPETVLEEVPLSKPRLREQLLDAIPASDGLEVLEGDTFIFGETGDQGLGGELT